MPELPEVEVARRNLRRWLRGRLIVRSAAAPSQVFRGSSPARFRRIRGRLASIDRKGKYLLFRFADGQGLLGHLGMTGRFVRRARLAPEPYSRAHWVLDSGEVIHFTDPRKFGRLEPVPADRLGELEPVKALGRDPLVDGLTARQLRDALMKTGRPLKVALLDQSRVAGLGNLHAAEALFRARLHPERTAQRLSPQEWKTLAAAIHRTLAFGLENHQREEVRYLDDGGDQENPFFVYGRGGEACRRCREPIAHFAQSGRTTYFCPGCQPRWPRSRRV